MTFQTITPKTSAPPVGPYSPAVKLDQLLFISGQIPLLPNGELVTGDFESETRQVLENIKALLNEAGLGFENVIKIGIFTTDLSQFELINNIYSEFVAEPFPARAAVEVAALPKGARIEMEAIAYVK
ncbi:MAG: Rid family detoxifying hydrolase [Candidatus Margulisiibacteriota bacterium]|nr:Rid family detoxifying hydrolase [Candidatus Margulisiibacteriota bacterium]